MPRSFATLPISFEVCISIVEQSISIQFFETLLIIPLSPRYISFECLPSFQEGYLDVEYFMSNGGSEDALQSCKDQWLTYNEPQWRMVIYCLEK